MSVTEHELERRAVTSSVTSESVGATWLARLKIEQDELTTRLLKLDAFMDKPAFDLLSHGEQLDLKIQKEAMGQYLSALVRRTRRAGPR